MVLIGEPNHGSKEIFLLRNSLIKFLHESHGFDIILFESGIGELIRADISKDQLTCLTSRKASSFLPVHNNSFYF
ncbi:MAG TPA: hypothetical protein VGO58_20420 [Chitinophagaceae bacterium]|jgi:erythromycin esterase|nr:hypothetical protein [Chitinophagaceae bacterium]